MFADLNIGSKRIVWNLLEYNNEPMLAIAMVLEDYMGQYGIVWNRGVVEVPSTTCADIIQEFPYSVIFTTKFTTK